MKGRERRTEWWSEVDTGGRIMQLPGKWEEGTNTHKVNSGKDMVLILSRRGEGTV